MVQLNAWTTEKKGFQHASLHLGNRVKFNILVRSIKSCKSKTPNNNILLL